MEKQEHGRKLKAGMAEHGMSRTELADALDVDPRTITNWTSGSTWPSDAQRVVLRRLLGNYDSEGDPVEAAVRRSRLTEDRQYEVVGYYKRKLREQDAEDEGRAVG